MKYTTQEKEWILDGLKNLYTCWFKELEDWSSHPPTPLPLADLHHLINRIEKETSL